jgi:hypothetical protein
MAKPAASSDADEIREPDESFANDLDSSFDAFFKLF